LVAFDFYQKSADLNYAPSITKIANYFYSGHIFDKDVNKAIELY